MKSWALRVANWAAATAAKPAALGSPGDTKGCADFEFYEDAKRWFDTYYPLYGDVARLDRDGNGIPCEKLPHTPVAFRRKIKKPQ